MFPMGKIGDVVRDRKRPEIWGVVDCGRGRLWLVPEAQLGFFSDTIIKQRSDAE